MRAIQSSKKRPGFLCRVLRMVGILVAILTAALGGLLVNQTRAVGHLRERYRPPGELIDVDDRLKHPQCAGTGSPTLVIDAGNGSFSLEWTPVQWVLGETTRVCTYDPAGYGWSEVGPEPRDRAQAVVELHALLREAGEQGALVLVGHSLGGIHAPIYATRHPDEVTALVLVDTMVDYTLSPEVRRQTQSSVGFYKVMRVLTGTGLLRALGPLGGTGMMPEKARKLPDDIRGIYLELVLDPEHETTAIAEMEQLGHALSQAGEAMTGQRSLGDRPVVVVTAGLRAAPGSTPFDENRISTGEDAVAVQGSLATLSSRGEQRVIAHCGHLMHLDAPVAVIDVVDEIR